MGTADRDAAISAGRICAGRCYAVEEKRRQGMRAWVRGCACSPSFFVPGGRREPIDFRALPHQRHAADQSRHAPFRCPVWTKGSFQSIAMRATHVMTCTHGQSSPPRCRVHSQRVPELTLSPFDTEVVVGLDAIGHLHLLASCG